MKKTPDPLRLLLILALTQVSLECVSLPSVCLANPVQERDTADESLNNKDDLPEAPEQFAELVTRGKVKFEFYDRRADPRKFPGETRFDFGLTFEYHYTFDIREIDGKRTAIIKPQLMDLKIACSNKVFLPMTFRSDNFWNEWLVAHEFEHVRLNSDARPRLLTEHLLKRIKIMDQTLEADESVDKDKIKESYVASVKAIRLEVVRIIQANNDYLDELTRHGVKKLEAPEAFFAELYSAENLAKNKFAYLDDVRTLLKSHDYRESE